MSLGEYGWWGNKGIFGSLGSWVKYGGNMEEVRKCGGRSRKMKGGVKRGVGGDVGKCVGVWER